MPSRAKRKRAAAAAARSGVTLPAAATASSSAVSRPDEDKDEVDDAGALSFISLSKYSALEDEDDIGNAIDELRREEKAELPQRRLTERSEQKEGPARPSSRLDRPGGKLRAVRKKQRRETQVNTAHSAVTSQSSRQQDEERGSAEKEEKAEAAAAAAAPPPPSAPPVLSRFLCNADKVQRRDDGSYLLRLHDGEFLCFHGSVALSVEFGYVNVNGHLLSPSSPHAPYELHSPVWEPSALLCIRHHHPATSRSSSRASAAVRIDEAVIVLSASSSPHRLHSAADASSSHLPIDIPAFHPLLQQSPASFARQPLSALSVSSAWSSLLSSLSAASRSSGPPSFLLCGRRNSGKSTLSRLLSNALLSSYRRVLYLDTDVGQCEHTPPSLLSLSLLSSPLLSPPHTRLLSASSSPSRLLLSFCTGETHFLSSPALHMDCVAALLRRVEEERRSRRDEALPLVVNTAGWMRGVGAVVLAETIAAVRPRHLLLLTANDEAEEEERLSVPEGSQLHRLPRYEAAASAASSVSAERLRTHVAAVLLPAAQRTARVVPHRLLAARCVASVPHPAVGCPAGAAVLSSRAASSVPAASLQPVHRLPSLLALVVVVLLSSALHWPRPGAGHRCRCRLPVPAESSGAGGAGCSAAAAENRAGGARSLRVRRGSRGRSTLHARVRSGSSRQLRRRRHEEQNKPAAQETAAAAMTVSDTGSLFVSLLQLCVDVC